MFTFVVCFVKLNTNQCDDKNINVSVNIHECPNYCIIICNVSYVNYIITIILINLISNSMHFQLGNVLIHSHGATANYKFTLYETNTKILLQTA